MTEKLSVLRADVQAGLSICMHMEDLYDRLIALFLQDNNFYKMIEALKNDDCEVAYNDAHAFKGVVLNIGFKHLSEILISLMQDLKDKDIEQARQRSLTLAEGYANTCKTISDNL